jgi:hypothetical protein
MKLHIYFVEENDSKEKYHKVGEFIQEAYPPKGTIVQLKKDDKIKKLIEGLIQRVETDERTPPDSTIWEGMKKKLLDYDYVGFEIERYEIMGDEQEEIRAYVTFFVQDILR